MQNKIAVPRLVLFLIPIVLIGPLSMDLYLPAIPLMRKSLNVNSELVQWTLSVFVLAFGLSQVLVGFFSAKIGANRCLSYSLIIYCLASLLASQSHTIDMVIVARFFQAISACFTMVLAMALVRHITDSVNENVKAYSLLSAATALAPIFAPIIGAQLLLLFNDWHVLFLFLALFSLLAFGIFTLAIQPKLQWQHAPESIIKSYLHVIRCKDFWHYCAYGAMGMMILFSFFSLSPLILIEHYQLTTSHFSMVFGAYGCCFLIGNLCAPYWAKHWPDLQGQFVAYAIISISCITGLVIFKTLKMHLLPFLAVMFIINFCIGLSFGPAMAGAMKPFKAQAEQASSIYGFQQFVFAFLVATSLVHFGWVDEARFLLMLLLLIIPINGWVYLSRKRNGTKLEEIKT